MTELPSRAGAVVIGGGVVGCSVAYHLAKRGLEDVVLLERKKLTSGTTWHAAGLVGQLRATHNMTRLARYSAELYAKLEAETGQATGFLRTGSITLATNSERLEELRRGASMARCFDVDVRTIGREDVRRMWPAAETDDIAGAVHLPGDAQTGPVDTTLALAAGARAGGATVLENTRVEDVVVRDRRVVAVETERGRVETDVVVNCAGMWARELAARVGVTVPLHAAEHFYVVTEPVEGVADGLPTLREPDGSLYYKSEAGGKLLIGFFEPVALPWGMDGIPADFEFDQLPDNWPHLEPLLEHAARRIPALERTGIRQFFNGPESFTPDDRYVLGAAPRLSGYFVAAGFNSVGIQSAGGAGRVLADWIIDGSPPMDLWDVDVRRALSFQRSPRYLHDRTVESLGLLYAMHWPFRQPETARGARRSPLHDRLAVRGACFGELAGWERANWFAPAGVQARYAYTYGRPSWFEHSAAEHRAVREGVGLFDQTSFAKLLVQGPDAEAALSRVCANDVAVEPGRVVYTQWLNERGGIEADVTATRLADDRYLIVTSPGSQVRDLDWLESQLPDDGRVSVTDVTSGFSVLGLMGPRARDLLARATRADLSNEAFPFATSQEVDLGYALVRATRITYVGELGYELYVPSEFAAHVYDTLVGEGEAFGLVHAGYHALDSLRLEKGYRHWGHDITPDDTPLEAGLGFAVALDGGRDFTGREALLRQREGGVRRRLVALALDDPEPLLYHDEPIWRDGELVGRTTSGGFGHTLGRPVALGWVESEEPIVRDYVASGRFELEIACERYPATASLRPLYDPRGERTRG